MPVTSTANIQAKPSSLHDEIEPERRYPFDLARGPRRRPPSPDSRPTTRTRHDKRDRAGEPRLGIAGIGGKERRDDGADVRDRDGGQQEHVVGHQAGAACCPA